MVGREGGSGGAGPLVFVPGQSGRSFARFRSLRGSSCPRRLPLVSGGSSSSVGDRRCPWALSFVGAVVVRVPCRRWWVLGVVEGCPAILWGW